MCTGEEKEQVAFGKLHAQLPHALGAATLAGEKRKTQRFTTSATYGYWFRRRDEGDLLWIPDGEITIDELLKLKEVREEDWSGKFETERWMEASKAGRIRIRDPNGSFHEYLERGSRKSSRKRSKID